MLYTIGSFFMPNKASAYTKNNGGCFVNGRSII